MQLMAKHQKPPEHRRPNFSLRLHPLLRNQLEVLVDRNASDLTAEISIAIREHLKREGLWPPPPSDE